MVFMDMERRALDEYLPGLADRLAGFELTELETDGNPGIEAFRACGGAKLVVPERFGGSGASIVDAARVLRELASLAPSTAVAAMMHQFSVTTLVAAVEQDPQEFAAFPDLLAAISGKRMLLASGFAEGMRGQNILEPTLRAERTDGGYLLNGVKKPCSLSGSMDLLTASVAVEQPDGSTSFGLLLLPADTPGISVHPYWSTFALAGAESDEVRLTDVLVHPDQVIAPDPSLADAVDGLTTVGLIWFQLTVCATYTGIASLLVEKVLHGARGSAGDRAALAVRVESAAALTEGLARRVDAGETDNDTLAAALVTRYAVQDAVTATVNQAVELLGGMAFIGSSDVAYLAAAAQAIAFHPPSRTSVAGGLLDYYAGYRMVVA